jgi:hypothetical protein
MPVAQSPAQFF